MSLLEAAKPGILAEDRLLQHHGAGFSQQVRMSMCAQKVSIHAYVAHTLFAGLKTCQMAGPGK